VFAHLGKYGKAEEHAGCCDRGAAVDCGRVAQERCGEAQSEEPHGSLLYKKPISFVGRDAEGINILGEKMMDIIFPPDIRSARRTRYAERSMLKRWPAGGSGGSYIYGAC
jgi:hypothetical protein